MNRAAKLAVGAVAFAAPITVGWAVTSDSSLPGDLFGHHTVDEFEMNGHVVVREDIDGTVTEIVTDPSGQILAPADYPADIAEALDDWAPPGPDAVQVDLDRSPACYTVVGEFVGEERVFGDVNGSAWALRANTEADGTVTIEAVVLDSVPGPEVADAYLDSDTPLVDFPGATEIDQCP